MPRFSLVNRRQGKSAPVNRRQRPQIPISITRPTGPIPQMASILRASNERLTPFIIRRIGTALAILHPGWVRFVIAFVRSPCGTSFRKKRPFFAFDLARFVAPADATRKHRRDGKPRRILARQTGMAAPRARLQSPKAALVADPTSWAGWALAIYRDTRRSRRAEDSRPRRVL
jgi:hypothetical protein